MSNPISLSAECVSYRAAKKDILQEVNFVAHAGQIMGVVGENGSGKSTLLKLAAGVLKPSAGGLSVAGKSVLSMKPNARALQIAYMPQALAVHAFSAFEAVLMAFYNTTRRFRSITDAQRELAFSTLQTLKIEHLSDKPFNELSGGEQRLVAFARTLAQQAPVMLMDEPMADLDIRHRLEFIDIVQAQARAGNTVVIAMHDLDVVLRYFDRVCILRAGRVLASGATNETLTEANIEVAFGVRVRIADSPEGLPRVELPALNQPQFDTD